MILKSDFRDYYDFAFSGRGPVLRRMTTEGPDKPEQFRLLAAAGYRVPEHGALESLQWWIGAKYVVYDDIAAHCGNGKRLIDLRDWPLRDMRKFAARFVGTGGFPESVRRLQIGRRVFAVNYISDDSWRSNCGDVTCHVAGEFDPYPPTGPLPACPLFAIDLVLGDDGEYTAVDLNVAPGVRGIGLERFLKPFDVVGEIEAVALSSPPAGAA